MSSLPCGKFQPSARVSTMMPIGWVRDSRWAGLPSQLMNQQVALRGGECALKRRVEQLALRIPAQAELRAAGRGRALGAGHPGLVGPDRRVRWIVGVEDRPDFLRRCLEPPVLLKKAPAVSPAKPFTERSPGSMMPAMLIPEPKTYWSAVPRGQMPPPTVDDPVAQICPIGEDPALYPVHREDVLRTGEEAEPSSGFGFATASEVMAQSASSTRAAPARGADGRKACPSPFVGRAEKEFQSLADCPATPTSPECSEQRVTAGDGDRVRS